MKLIVVCAWVVLILPLLLARATSATQLSGTWSLGAQRFSPRQKYHLVTFPNGTVVIVGGRAEEGRKSDFWTGSLNSSVWSWKETYFGGTMPGLEAMSLHFVGDSYYMFGGKTDSTNGVSELWTIRNDLWEEVPSSVKERPLGRYRHQGVTLTSTNDAFVVMFGTSVDRGFNDVWLFNATTSSWAELHSGGEGEDVPEPRFDPCCHFRLSSNSIICFGGTKDLTDTDEVWEFFLGNSTWKQRIMASTTTTDQSPSKRRLPICSFVTPDVLVVWGGYSSNDSDNAPSDSTYALNLLTNTWTSVSQDADSPTARDGAFLSPYPSDEGNVFMFGGFDTLGQSLNDIWRLDTTTFKFTRNESALSAPAARAEHSAVVIGSSMVVLFGLGTSGLLQDVWQLDVESGVWTLLSSVCPFGARQAAAAVARGNSVLVVGGMTDDGPTNELLSFDVSQQTWSQIPTFNAPPGRYRHSVALLDSTHLVMLGGTTLETERTSDMFLFDPSTSNWYTVEEIPAEQVVNRTTTVLPARRSFGLIHDPGTDTLVALGGKNSAVLMDRWHLTLNTTDRIKPTMVAVQLPSSVGDSGEVERQYIRSEAAIIGAGRHYIVCGGSISESFPVPEASACYQYDSVLGTNTLMQDRSPVASYMSSGVYIQGTMYIFGGNLIHRAIKRTNTYLNLVQRFSFETPCSSLSTADDSSCMHCAPGSSLSTIDDGRSEGSSSSLSSSTPTTSSRCEFVEVGYYTSPKTSSIVGCGEGRYSTLKGAHDALFCLPCADGSHNNQTGQSSCVPCPADSTCPVGATNPRAASDVKQSVNVETQPPHFVTEGVSLWNIGMVGVAGACAILIVVLVAWVENTRYQSLASYYVPKEAERALQCIYRKRLVAETGGGLSRGLSGSELLNALSDVGHLLYQWDTAEVETKLTAATVDDLVEYFDQSGMQHLRYPEFKIVICMLFERQCFTAIPGTPFHDKGGTIRAVERPYLQLEDLDHFATQHKFWTLGEPVNTQNTRAGGIMSLIGITGILSVGALLVLLFFVDNLEETRSTLPQVAVVEDVTARMVINVTTLGEDNQEFCIEVGTVDQCISGSRIDITDGVNGSSSTRDPTCSFISPGYCTMHWVCPTCTFTNSTNTVGFLFGHPDWYSTETVVIVSVDSGIRDEFGSTTDGIARSSFISHVLTPDVAGHVLKGYPASTLTLAGVPTTFKAPRSVLDTRFLSSTGYHISAPESVVGNEATVAELPTHVGVPVEVTFEVAVTFLVVERFLKKDIVGLGASMLGVLSGVMAVAGFFLAAHDRFSKWETREGEGNSQDGGDLNDGEKRGGAFNTSSFSSVVPVTERFDPNSRDLEKSLGSVRKRRVVDEEADNLVKVCHFKRQQARALIDAMTKIASAAGGKSVKEVKMAGSAAVAVEDFIPMTADLKAEGNESKAELLGSGSQNPLLQDSNRNSNNHIPQGRTEDVELLDEDGLPMVLLASTEETPTCMSV